MSKNNSALTLFIQKGTETIPTKTIIGSQAETMNALLVNSNSITSSKEDENGEYYYSGINLVGYITKVVVPCKCPTKAKNSGGGVVLPKVEPDFVGLERSKND